MKKNQKVETNYFFKKPFFSQRTKTISKGVYIYIQLTKIFKAEAY